VGLSIRKSPHAIVMMLGCLIAGVPYVPMDPAAPLGRRRQILADADPRLLFVSADATGDWPGEDFGVPVDLPGTVLSGGLAVARRPATGSAEIARDDLAYVLYTSGSTGTPKGVKISTANAGYFVDWAAAAFPLGPGDQVAQHAPLHFDLPVYDVFATLISGACLHLMDERTVMFPAAAYRFLYEREITALYAVPSALNSLLRRSGLPENGLPGLRRLLYAGEEFHVPRLAELVAALPEQARVANLYGPVETNVVTWAWVTHRLLAGDRMPIGSAVPGTVVRLLGEDGVLRSASAEGELLVSGPSVTPGYLNDPERTARALVSLACEGVERVFYRTGDLASADDAGVLRFQGRRDGMVKTRGFRVELGDVEAAVLRHPRVVQAVVRPVPDAELGTLLEAHVVLDGASVPLTPGELRRWLAGQVPTYMVPVSVHVHEELPVTSTGKIARSALGGAHG
jgi:amino acid adenylation domain-containing protein